jgi:chromosomal replication initiation ATPase DnaA
MENTIETTDLKVIEIEKKHLIAEIEKMIKTLNDMERSSEYVIGETRFKKGYKLTAIRAYTNVNLEKILKECCELAFKISDITAPIRSQPYVFARNTFSFIYKNIISTKIPLSHIGMILGGKDHSTIIHGLETFKIEYETNEGFRNKFHHVCELLEERGIYIEIENKI